MLAAGHLVRWRLSQHHQRVGDLAVGHLMVGELAVVCQMVKGPVAVHQIVEMPAAVPAVCLMMKGPLAVPVGAPLAGFNWFCMAINFFCTSDSPSLLSSWISEQALTGVDATSSCPQSLS